nr:helix-turn-helix transcriptional regulator [Planctomycetota bacterium]
LHERALPAAALLCRIKSLVFTALAGLFASLPATQARRCFAVVERRKAVHPALAHIEDRLGEPISNRQLAALCAMTEDRFIRRFRDEVGQTPAQFVLERRVATAAQRLLFTDDPIDAIAERSGFANRFHFSRIFAARMGAPPAAYRRKGRA